MHTLGIEYDQKSGVIVVGIDISTDGSNNPQTLTAAVGASAVIDVDSTQGFIYAPKPTLGQDIVEGGSSFVTFPNVAVGRGCSCKTTARNEMRSRSAGTDSGESVEVTTQADSVTVVSYICH